MHDLNGFKSVGGIVALTERDSLASGGSSLNGFVAGEASALVYDLLG